MKSVLLIISILCLHYPLGLFKDTMRRYNRMKYYGTEWKYQFANAISPIESNPITRFPGFLTASFASFILALFPMFELFNIHWILIIFINLMITYIFAPMLAFITIPFRKILMKRLLKIATYLFNTIGIISYALGGVINNF